jgi:ABC-type glutathione transport system ATPase component
MSASRPFVRVRGLTKRYARRGLLWRSRIQVDAASDVTFEIPQGKTLALVGSSGSGKSTVARCVTRLEKPDAGQIWLGDTDISQLTNRELLPFRMQVQMVFQDAVTSMSPRFSAAEVIEEPQLIQRRGSRSERRQVALGLMAQVGLSPDSADRSAMEFSGGQRQRLAIARALALRPKLIVFDEALSGVDLSTEAQICNLLLDLQAAHSLTYLFISHDLPLVARLADSIAVISAGRIVEYGPTEKMISRAEHPETTALMASANAFQLNYARMLGHSG